MGEDMKAIVLSKYGGPELFQLMDLPKPVPQPGEVVVRVHASAVDPGNMKRAPGVMRGFMPEIEFPWVPGAAIAGSVEEVGAGLTAFRPGDAVYGYRATGGAYAEFIAVNANELALKPISIDDAQAASIAGLGNRNVLHRRSAYRILRCHATGQRVIPDALEKVPHSNRSLPMTRVADGKDNLPDVLRLNRPNRHCADGRVYVPLQIATDRRSVLARPLHNLTHVPLPEFPYRKAARMRDTFFTVDADMRLGAEVVLVAFLGLMHLGIARLLFVLGRRWRGDDGGIDDHAGGDANSLAVQVPVHRIQNPSA